MSGFFYFLFYVFFGALPIFYKNVIHVQTEKRKKYIHIAKN